MWMATETNWAGNGRACVPRFYEDDEASPSVEVPLTNFFAVGHDLFAPVRSLAVLRITSGPVTAFQRRLPDPIPAARYETIPRAFLINGASIVGT